MKRPSFGTILGATACVIALSSTGVAADAASLISGSHIKPNTITTKQIKNGTIGAIDIAPGVLPTIGDGSISSAKLADGSVTSGKLANGSVASGKLADGSVTATKLGTITVRTDSIAIATGSGGFKQVSCLSGEKIIGGGETTSGVGVSAGWTLIRSSETNSNGWDAAAWNTTGSTGTLIVQAYCLQG